MFQLSVYSQPTWYDFDSTLNWARVSGITLSINFTDLLLSSSSSHSVIPHSPCPSEVEKKHLRLFLQVAILRLQLGLDRSCIELHYGAVLGKEFNPVSCAPL